MNSTQQLTWYIQNNKPCIFVKYGDGEYNAANYLKGYNCDNTPYTKNLGDSVRESFVYNSQQLNSMIAKWNDEQHTHFWESLGNSNVNWVDFHTIIIDNSKPVNHNNDRLELFKSIKESKLKKIYIANPYMHRAKQIFNIDSHIKIDSSNWFETEYESVFNSIKESIEDEKNTLILTSAGMGSKFLISELHKLYPKVLYIDIGSAFDKLLRGQHTRSNAPSIHELELYLKSLL